MTTNPTLTSRVSATDVAKIRHVPEILAPAGGRAQFFAALNAGADAVYLGLKGFNARARAENFSVDDLRELVPLAHTYGMGVLMTVNVLIKDVELPDLIGMLADLEELEVDAIIVQDLAIARIARAHFPGLRLHASTQMAVHNLAGVRMAQELGFRRVVLARELTALELRKIRAAVPRDEVQLEAFCHGSLCYSYSGLCFFSGAEDARSGNRGECAYTCRQPYKITSEPGHGFLFSMRDLDTSDNVDLFVKAGIDTLKIEGRKKDAQYVASSVRLYRDKLDQEFGASTLRKSAPAVAHGKSTIDPKKDLSLSFQRQPTSLFLRGRYHEDVIDLDSPTHAGIKIGSIEKVDGALVTFTTATHIERFDGLRILPGEKRYHSLPRDGAEIKKNVSAAQRTYDNENIEFSLRDLTVGGRRAFEAKAGATVTIELPDAKGGAKPQLGDVVFKTRSADLKRRVEALAVPPPDAKPRPFRLVDVTVDVRIQGDLLVVKATATKHGDLVAEAACTLEPQPATGGGDLATDTKHLFNVFGDAGFRATTVRFAGDTTWFVPKSILKKLKNELADQLPNAYDSRVAKRKEKALAAIVTPPKLPMPATMEDRTFAVKTDRLETLRAVAAYAQSHSEFRLAELVFEPKRAFLAELDPDGLAAELVDIQTAAVAPIRLAVPTVVRAWDEPLLERWFRACYERGIRRVEIGNLGAFKLLEDWQLPDVDVASDFTLYALNSCTTRLWRELGVKKVCLSIEDDLQNLRSHTAGLADYERNDLQAVLFKDTPLFIAEACSLTALHGGCPTAKVCGYRSLEVENPKGEKFHVAHESCKSIVYGDDAYSITHKQSELLKLGIKQFRLDFLTRQYDAAGVDKVLDAAVSAGTLARTHTANFDRTLL